MFDGGGCSLSVVLSQLTASRLVLDAVLLGNPCSCFRWSQIGSSLPLLCIKNKSKKQMFLVKMGGVFLRATHSLSSGCCFLAQRLQLLGGKKVKSPGLQSKILPGWTFPVWVSSFGGWIHQVRVSGVEMSPGRMKYSYLHERPQHGRNISVYSGWDVVEPCNNEWFLASGNA